MPSPQAQKVIAHADMDAFYAAVEQLDHPELRGHPVLVGPPSGRGVVLTASYEARPYRVGSAMPMRQALRRCPEAVVVPPRFHRYAEVSATIMRVFGNFSPQVEPLSMDEAFIDLTGTAHLFGRPAAAARAIKAAICSATGGLPVSVGVASSKFVAKVASGHDKPDGLCVVAPGTERDWLAPLPVSRLWGAGPKTQALLRQHGYQTIGDVARAAPDELLSCFGALGQRFAALARATDPRPVLPHRRARSMSCDRTLHVDTRSRAELRQHLRRAADELGSRLRRRGCVAGSVRVKLKTSKLHTLSRQCTLAEPSDVGRCLYGAAAQLLDKFDHPGPFRLVGMAVHNVATRPHVRQVPLWQTNAKAAKLEQALDQLNARYGRGTMRRARDLTGETVLTSTATLDFVGLRAGR